MILSDSIISFLILIIACAISRFFTITYQLNTFFELLIVAVVLGDIIPLGSSGESLV